MTTGELLSIAGFNMLVISATAAFLYKIYSELKNIRDEGESKRSRIYERMDEVKNGMKEDFTSKDVCKILHEQLSRDVTEIKADVKTILRNNGFGK